MGKQRFFKTTTIVRAKAAVLKSRAASKKASRDADPGKADRAEPRS